MIIGFQVLEYLPEMAVLVAIQMVLPLLISGPIASQFLARDASLCSRSWWKNLLFIHNFYKFDEQVSSVSLAHFTELIIMLISDSPLISFERSILRPVLIITLSLSLSLKCVLNSWTISTEIQLYSLLTFLVLLYSKAPLLAKGLNLVLLLSSLAYIVTSVYSNDLSPQFIQMPFDLNRLKVRANLIHFAPYAHVLEFFLPPFVFNLIFNKRIVRFHEVRIVSL